MNKKEKLEYDNNSQQFWLYIYSCVLFTTLLGTLLMIDT